jgi:DNA-binding NarL/FixJ family response regulator
VSALRVVVADDHPLMLNAVALRLDAEPDIHVVARADSTAGLLAAVSEFKPDVAVVDLTMRDGTTLDIFDRLAAASANTRFLLLSASENASDVHAAVRAGAAGFLSKSVDPDEIPRYVREVASGATVLDTPSASAIAEQLRQPTFDALSPRELEILALVGQGLTNRAIAQQLFVSLSTVKTYLERVFAKLSVSDRAAAIAKAKDQKLI